MNLRTNVAAAALALTTLASSGAQAAQPPTSYSVPGAFYAQGPIAQTTNFTAFAAGQETFVSSPYVDGALSISSAQNIIFGQGFSPYGPVANALADDYYTPITGTITQPGFNLVSLQIANLIGSRDFNLELHYFDGVGDNFANFTESTALSSQGFQFYGFALPMGEYFEDFVLSANNTPQDLANDQGTGVAISQIELGYRAGPSTQPGGVPEPSTWAILIIGFGLTGAMLRTVRAQVRQAA